MTRKEKLECVSDISLTIGALIALIAGAKAISCLLLGLVLFTTLTSKISNTLWRKK